MSQMVETTQIIHKKAYCNNLYAEDNEISVQWHNSVIGIAKKVLTYSSIIMGKIIVDIDEARGRGLD